MGSNNYSTNRLANGAILIISTILKHLMLSAVEAEIGSVFINAKEATVVRKKLEEMGHHQPLAPLQTEQTTATGYSNDTIKQKQTRQWICVFTGSKIYSTKASFMFSGVQGTNIRQIILRNNIPWLITKERV
jgi:hypothetical protein